MEDDEVGDEEDKSKLVTTGENFNGGAPEDWGSSPRDSQSLRKRTNALVLAFS